MKVGKVGTVNSKIISKLHLDTTVSDIFIGQSNINHMIKKHPIDYEKYSKHLKSILNKPDYIRLNRKDGSIEYVKEFKINNEFVKVAVRVSNSDKWYVRSMYVLNNNRVRSYIEKGHLIKY